MRIVNFIGYVVFLFIFINIMVACNEPVDTLGEVTVNLTEENRTFLFNTNAARNKARSNGLGGPVGFIFRLGGNLTLPTNDRSDEKTIISPYLTTQAFLNGQITLEDFNADSLASNMGDPLLLPDCFTEDFFEGEDGSYVYIIDFGNGCDLSGEYLRGRITEKGFQKNNKFRATITYDGFGNNFWEIDGSYSYQGVWEYSIHPGDSSEYDWSARYFYNYDLKETYETADDFETVSSKGNGTEVMDLDGYTVMKQQNEIVYGSGHHFTTSVDEPLFQDFNCDENTFIFVRGVETGTYKSGDFNTNFKINYGDSECDNIITIIEGENETVIDLSEEYNRHNDADSD